MSLDLDVWKLKNHICNCLQVCTCKIDDGGFRHQKSFEFPLCHWEKQWQPRVELLSISSSIFSAVSAVTRLCCFIVVLVFVWSKFKDFLGQEKDFGFDFLAWRGLRSRVEIVVGKDLLNRLGLDVADIVVDDSQPAKVAWILCMFRYFSTLHFFFWVSLEPNWQVLARKIFFQQAVKILIFLFLVLV